MFGRKKRPIVNEVFGEVKYCVLSWEAVEKFPFVLFGETYMLGIEAVAREKEPISKAQEDVFSHLKQNLAAAQETVERLLAEEYQTSDTQALKARLEFSDIQISQAGECAITVFDKYEQDCHGDTVDLAVMLYPKAMVYDGECYAGYIFGGGGLDDGGGIHKKGDAANRLAGS